MTQLYTYSGIMFVFCGSFTRTRLGFHVPPFNTVNHLHLHVLGGELKSRFRKLKYQTGRVWYQDLEQVLDKYKRVSEGARL